MQSPGERMAQAGIVQVPDPMLNRFATLFDLPVAADEARGVVDTLLSVADRVRALHVFRKGMGIAAPQIGIDRAAAVVIPPARGAQPVILLNPRIASESAEHDEQYEGCLSFFHVRGLVPRSLRIEVTHTELTGREHVTGFEYGMARLVYHEVDHLHGMLYTARMRPGTEPIPVEEYRGAGCAWHYDT
jgi:peptide deformylase